VATAQLLPIYSKISQKILGRTVRRREIVGTEIVEGFGRFLLALQCPVHEWSWPRANREERYRGYDAHQTCHKCTSRRMFDTREWQAGPLYRQNREYSL
jgi:hypothetical protein